MRSTLWLYLLLQIWRPLFIPWPHLVFVFRLPIGVLRFAAGRLRGIPSPPPYHFQFEYLLFDFGELSSVLSLVRLIPRLMFPRFRWLPRTNGFGV